MRMAPSEHAVHGPAVAVVVGRAQQAGAPPPRGDDEVELGVLIERRRGVAPWRQVLGEPRRTSGCPVAAAGRPAPRARSPGRSARAGSPRVRLGRGARHCRRLEPRLPRCASLLLRSCAIAGTRPAPIPPRKLSAGQRLPGCWIPLGERHSRRGSRPARRSRRAGMRGRQQAASLGPPRPSAPSPVRAPRGRAPLPGPRPLSRRHPSRLMAEHSTCRLSPLQQLLQGARGAPGQAV